ncbi:MAG: regulatory iron-sulfur-containing complex subunit RicT [Chloroflexota bacterium]|nr:regulatory iron-sulfur-containing complex subunit RicT [Chloroflexota bacterium]MDE2895423.1 regulatory iron-sulfur-containing complex subunit RicT [Chloroflexota bacterium]
MNHLPDDGAPAQSSSDSSQDDPACSIEATETVAAIDEQVVIGIRIREASRIYHFSAPRGQVYPGDYVVVDRARGDQLARVVTVPDDDASANPIPRDVRPIVRLADSDDRARAAEQSERADSILRDMRSAAVREDLGLYPVAVELNLTGDRGTAWFQAPDHVDFRPMLDEVQEQYDVQLHMQQANQRERARLVDGYDICGLRLCCSSWMTDFPHVGIRVAKDQDLSLNPDSISGVCGRLLCCLTFEHEVYREMRGSLPRVGKRVSTPAGMGKVIKLNVLQQKVTISLDDHPQRVDVPADEIGLAVRTEDAPNQALVEAEQARREADRRAAALREAAAPSETADQPDEPSDRPGKRRRRRSRRSQSERRQDQDAREDRPVAQPESGEGETGEGPARRPSRRRRRRKPKVVNQQSESAAAESAATSQRPDGEQRRPRRRRRRSRQRVNEPDQSPDPSE